MQAMIRSNRAVIALASLLAVGCTTTPNQQLEVSGRVPPPGAIRMIAADGNDELRAATDAAHTCLAQLGYTEGQAAALLLQLAHAVRPARAQVVAGPGQPIGPARRGSARRDQEELSLTFTDPATGALLWRGAVSRRLGKGEAVADGAGLIPPLCTALRDGRAAASR